MIIAALTIAIKGSRTKQDDPEFLVPGSEQRDEPVTSRRSNNPMPPINENASCSAH